MDNKTIIEWFYLGDADYDSALILSNAFRKHHSIICFHCQLAVEKYLKGALCFYGVNPPKIHSLEILCQLCSDFDESFDTISMDCAYLSQFAVAARYPLESEITELNSTKALEQVKRINDFSALFAIREKIGYVSSPNGDR